MRKTSPGHVFRGEVGYWHSMPPKTQTEITKPLATLLKALGYNVEQLLEYFYDLDIVIVKKGKFMREIDIDRMAGQRALEPNKSGAFCSNSLATETGTF